jgi:N-carbamoyl-L-amino-acid hydrolase
LNRSATDTLELDSSDDVALAERMKAAMLFVPSIGGISHHYAEDTKDEDIVFGCQVFADAAAEILAGWAKSAGI